MIKNIKQIFNENKYLVGRVDVRSTNECWNWLRGTREGYGRVRVLGKKVSVHRLVYEIFYGSIPESKPVIRHKCDNRLCVNPLHLLSGTIVDNVSDRVVRNRSAKGEASGRAKISKNDVEQIRKRYVPYKVTMKSLSLEYGICLRQVWMIITNRSWKS
jgi:hypothetical protein